MVSRRWMPAARSMPDCVLLDWNMPVMDGLEFLKQLRAEYGPDKPPVVFCTTETEMSAIELAITNGAQEYIMKPFDEEILRRQVRAGRAAVTARRTAPARCRRTPAPASRA